MKGSILTCDRLKGPAGCCTVGSKMQREEQTLRGCAQGISLREEKENVAVGPGGK